MPRSSRKRRGPDVSTDDGDAVMADAENSPSSTTAAAASASASPDPMQPSPSKRIRIAAPTAGGGRRSRPGKKTSPKPPPKLKVRIKRFHGVARWSWNVGGSAVRAASFSGGQHQHQQQQEDEEEDVCGICQNPFEGVAPGMKYPGDDCPLERGPCNHCFHLQCVNRWLGTKKSCPICRADWPT
mmetsp:Transcript_20171/g.41126  ORF Transcript_20171/g.41126 Transcript_20171/m.41126 type:complete len:184 (-) Transcript_20171:371-922(-)